MSIVIACHRLSFIFTNPHKQLDKMCYSMKAAMSMMRDIDSGTKVFPLFSAAQIITILLRDLPDMVFTYSYRRIQIRDTADTP